MKKLIMPSNIEQINDLKDYYDGLIVGLDNFCVNMPYDFNLEEIDNIIDICNKNNKEVFISLNKNITNSELEELKNILIKLDKSNINGILYYDVAIVNIKRELNLDIKLVWSQEHLTTNYLTCNFWSNYGVDYVYLSNEITLDEINTIKSNTKLKTMTTMFGYLPMFVSKRHLVKNYLDTFNLKDNSKINYLYKEDKYYQIIDNKNGTIAYSSRVLNGISEVLKVKTDYIILNSFSIDSDIFKEVLKMFYTVNDSNVIEYRKKIDSMLETDSGFLYKETIYKVK